MPIFLAMRSHDTSTFGPATRSIGRQIVCAVKSCDYSFTAYSLAVIPKTCHIEFEFYVSALSIQTS